MIKPTDELRQEHDAILEMLKVMESILKKKESGETYHLTQLEGVVEFLKIFADLCHHGKEEDYLFPALEQAGIPREGGPIGVMLHEHIMGRDFIRGISDGILRKKVNDPEADGIITRNMGFYIQLLTQHIQKENNILFTLAEMHLDEGVQKEISLGFRKVETERLGPGKHEELKQILNNLKSACLE